MGKAAQNKHPVKTATQHSFNIFCADGRFLPLRMPWCVGQKYYGASAASLNIRLALELQMKWLMIIFPSCILSQRLASRVVPRATPDESGPVCPHSLNVVLKFLFNIGSEFSFSKVHDNAAGATTSRPIGGPPHN